MPLLLITLGMSSMAAAQETVGKIERVDPALDRLVPPDAKIEKLADGFEWSEGPVWFPDASAGAGGGYLLFSDVPKNVIFRWSDADGLSEFLKPSGYSGDAPRGGEPGSNGLTRDAEGRLVICQHGDRRVARLEKDGKTQTAIAEQYEGKRFNSPNDLCYDAKGNLYFTDPPYGLEGGNDSPKKEIPFNGVYRVTPDGKVTLISKESTFPNGIALSPDEKTLYVAQSDPAKPVILAFNIAEEGVANGRVFFDCSKLPTPGPGLPDGLKLDTEGNIFCTAPGGVIVLSPEGKHLGTIRPSETEASANCAWGGDGSVLYITNDSTLCRIKLNTKGTLPGAAK